MRETLEVDVLVVGGGPAGLSAALRLSQVAAAAGEPLVIAVLEKAREPGGHSLSGAILDPSALADLVPDYVERGAPLGTPVESDQVYVLSEHGHLALPIVPPPLRNHGNHIISLNHLVRWLSTQVEAHDVNLFTGFAGQDVLFDGDRVVGVRTGDRGRDREGHERPGFEPGVDILAKVTIFCDGVRGNLTKQLMRRLALGLGREPQQFSLGIKELWRIPEGRFPAGHVAHTLGYPLRHEEFGGAFLYGMADQQLALGLVVGLDYQDPRFDPHDAFNRLKRHPLVADLLAGGELLRYGAKALPEGGWHTIPRCHMDGALIAGDAAGFLNSVRLKGIHLAMRSGMLAAETACAAVRAGDTSSGGLHAYQAAIDASAIRDELYPVRNVHQAFAHGLLPGLAFAGAAMVTGGGWFGERLPGHAGHHRMRTVASYYGVSGAAPLALPAPPPPDRVTTFDTVTGVHHSGTAHREDQPSHLLVHTEVCHSICGEEYGHPCTRFCPASVYEIVDDGAGGRRLQVHASNCVHCKTCDIMDPYAVITWVPPEGGDGPQYNGM